MAEKKQKNKTEKVLTLLARKDINRQGNSKRGWLYRVAC